LSGQKGLHRGLWMGRAVCTHTALLKWPSPFHPPTLPQVFYAWSKRCDAVLEVECTGRWREACDALRTLGVTDQELVSVAPKGLLVSVLTSTACCVSCPGSAQLPDSV